MTADDDRTIAISGTVRIPLEEVEFQAVRASGPGGQNVNKVSSAVHLRFDIRRSSLPPGIQRRLLSLEDGRITRDGIVVIKSKVFRTLERNRREALSRLTDLVRSAMVERKPRVPTKPGRVAQRKRLDAKARRGRIKAMRRRVPSDQD